MGILKKIFTLVGAIVVIGFLIAFFAFKMWKMDGGALGAYASMAAKVVTTGDPAKGMILKEKLIIPEGMSKKEAIDNAKEALDEHAEEYGLSKVDSKTMPRGGKFMKDGGKYTHIRSYCSVAIAHKFLNHSGEFIGFMPCRVGIVEDDNGDIHIYTMALDLMIHGGHRLPNEMLELANQVKSAMHGMIKKAATVNVD